MMITDSCRRRTGEASGGVVRSGGWSQAVLSSGVLPTGPSGAAEQKKKEESVRTKFAILLAVAVVCVTAAWGWTPEVPITNNRLENYTSYNNGHKVVYDRNGFGHLVWHDNKGEAVYYKRYDPNTGRWSKDLQLARTASYPNPTIALDSNGTTIHVVWRMWKHVGTTNFHIYYWKCDPTGSGTDGWVGKPFDLCENVSGHDHVYPAVACGPNGQVVVTWMEAWGYPDVVRSYGFREFTTSGGWRPQELIDDPIPAYRWMPSISTDKSGNVFVAYYGSTLLGPRPSFDVYVKSRLNDVWQPWENATAGLTDADSFLFPDLDVNPTTGRPHIVCHSYSISVSETNPPETTRYYYIYHSYSPSTGVWAAQMISEKASSGGANMFFDANGTAHVVWHGYDADLTNFGIKYASCHGDDGSWTTPYPLTVNASSVRDVYANITVGADGVLYVVWTRNNSASKYPYQIWGISSSGSFGEQAAGTTVPSREYTLHVSPNPASRRMVVNYSLPVAGNVSLKLYDVSGAFVKTVACGHTLPGSHAVSLSREGLARGAYILKLQSGASSVTRKLVIE